MQKDQLKAITECCNALFKLGGKNIKERPILHNMLITGSTIEYSNLFTGLRYTPKGGNPFVVEPLLIPISQTLNFTSKTKAIDLELVPDGRCMSNVTDLACATNLNMATTSATQPRTSNSP